MTSSKPGFSINTTANLYSLISTQEQHTLITLHNIIGSLIPTERHFSDSLPAQRFKSVQPLSRSLSSPCVVAIANGFSKSVIFPKYM